MSASTSSGSGALRALKPLAAHAALLARIAYKSSAQHAAARPFRAVEAVRGALARLPAAEAAVRRARGAVREAEATGADLARHRAVAAYHVLRIALLLLEVEHRAGKAFAQLNAHLRTPPAPTFAPLFLVQLSLCAKVAADACAALYGPGAGGSSSDEGLCGMYASLQSSAAADSQAIALPLRSPHSGKPLTRRQRAVVVRATEAPRGGAAPKDLGWLPMRLQRPSRPARDGEPAAAASTSAAQPAQPRLLPKQPPGRNAPAVASAPSGMDDEDIGEAI